MSKHVLDPVITAKDPHHHGIVEWAFVNNKFYQRHEGHSKWAEVKRFHATPDRINMLHALIHQ